MSSVLMSFSAVLQTWNAAQNVERSVSHPVPTFSGIVGMVANAMGRTREDSILDLAALGYAVRVERPGVLISDFHTQQWLKKGYPDGAAFADLSRVERQNAANRDHLDTQIKEVAILSDASFTVALDAEEGFAEEIAAALEVPRRPIYLGKTLFPLGSLARTDEETFLPTVSVSDRDAVDALRDGKRSQLHRSAQPDEIADYSVRDTPVSFQVGRRSYLTRRVVIDYS